jgi:hypothetical protein
MLRFNMLKFESPLIFKFSNWLIFKLPHFILKHEVEQESNDHDSGSNYTNKGEDKR